VSEEQRKIRVLHLIDSLELGGAQTVLFALLQDHDRSRCDVHLASIHGTPASLFYERAMQSNIPVILLSPKRWLPIYLFQLPVRLMLGHYDVVHCHLFASNWLGKTFARFLGVPVVISHDHCNDAFRSRSVFVTLIDRFANGICDRIFAVSKSIRDYLVDHEKIRSDKVRLMPNGLPAGPSRHRPREYSGKVVGGAGRFVPQKNFDRFLRIASLLHQMDSAYRFRIAGNGPLDQSLRTKAEELGVEVEWLGAQPSLDRFFKDIDLFLLTSDFEGLPMTVLEALQAGVPIAAMAVDGIEEEFIDEIMLLTPTSSDFEIAQRIVALMADPDALSAQTQRGLALVSSRFSARDQIREIERVYVDLLARKQRRD